MKLTAKQRRKEVRKFLFLGCLAMFLSVLPYFIDGLMQWAGLEARAHNTLWKVIWIGICSIFNLSLFFSSIFRRALGIKFWKWLLINIPVIFSVSILTTMMSQSAFIAQQAAIVETSKQIAQKRFEIVDGINANAKRQTQINHVTRAGSSLAAASNQLDKAQAEAQTQQVTSAEAATIPLSIINALLPRSMSVNTFLVLYYTLLSFGLLLAGNLFGELSGVCFDRASNIANYKHDETISDSYKQSQTSTNKSKHKKLTDEHTQTAISKKLFENPDTHETDINRAWVDQAMHAMYGKSRAGQTLDKFIKPTKAMIS